MRVRAVRNARAVHSAHARRHPHNANQECKLNASLQTLAQSRPQFVAFVHKRVGALHDAEDIVNAAFVKATSAVDKLRSASDARAWFYRVLRNAVIDFYRSPQRKEEVSDAMDDRPATVLAATDSCACAAPLLAELPDAYAEVLQEVARNHGKGLDGASRVRLSRARSAMRKKMAQRCGTSSARPCSDCACS